MRMALRVHKPERGDGEVHTAVIATTLAALPSADIAPAISPSRPMQQVPASGQSHTERSSFEWLRASFRRSHRPMLWGSLLVASNGSRVFDRANRRSTVEHAPDY